MVILVPFVMMYSRHWIRLNIGIILNIITTLANIILLIISGWLLIGTALIGPSGLYTFNYMLPAAGIRGLSIIRTTSRYAERIINHDTTFRILTYLRIFIFQNLLQLSSSGISYYDKGDIFNRLVTDVKVIDHLYLRVFSPILSNFIIIILFTFFLSRLNMLLTFILSIIMLCLIIHLPIFFYNLGKSIGYDLTILRSKYRTCLINIIQSQAELTIFGAFNRFRKILTNLEYNLLKRQEQQFNLTTLAQSIMIFFSGFSIILVIWIGADAFDNQNQFKSLIALFIFSVLAIFEVLGSFAIAFQYLGEVITSINRLMELINQKPIIRFPIAEQIISNKVEIKIQKIYFSYPKQIKPALQNISFTIKIGEHIALLGKTGCGKSTLLQLLTRAWDVNSGKILINDIPIQLYDEKTLRNLIAVVPQRIHIFSDTLRNNLLIAKDNLKDTFLIKVLNKVGLYSLSNNKGLNSWIGEGGRQLSGGEKQRLGIARAMLCDAPLILLDEPTEGLDIKTEKHIIMQLQDYCNDKTLLFITHRLHGLENMNNIYIMDEGKIIKQTTYEELLKLKNRYLKYYQNKTILN